MRPRVRLTRVAVAALTAAALARAPLAHAGTQPAHLEGFVRGLDGRPGSGLRVRLLDARGAERASAVTERSGRYALDVAPGRYALLLDGPDTGPVPVLAPPVRLTPGVLARRDVQLVAADPATASARLDLVDASFGEWWKGVPPSGKALFVAGIVVGVGVGIAAFGGGGNEVPASPF